jgi:hypothetical protein
MWQCSIKYCTTLVAVFVRLCSDTDVLQTDLVSKQFAISLCETRPRSLFSRGRISCSSTSHGDLRRRDTHGSSVGQCIRFGDGHTYVVKSSRNTAYRLLAYTTENGKNLTRVLAYPRVPQEVIEVC